MILIPGTLQALSKVTIYPGSNKNINKVALESKFDFLDDALEVVVEGDNKLARDMREIIGDIVARDVKTFQQEQEIKAKLYDFVLQASNAATEYCDDEEGKYQQALIDEAKS